MSTFWQNIVAASSLTVGTVWDLITHPRTGGTGVVVNNGATAMINDTAPTVTLADASMALVVTVLDPRYTVAVDDSSLIVTLDVETA